FRVVGHAGALAAQHDDATGDGVDAHVDEASGQLSHLPGIVARPAAVALHAVDRQPAAHAAQHVIGGQCLVQPHGHAAGHRVEVDGVRVADRVDEDRAGHRVDGGLAERAGHGDVAGDAVGDHGAAEPADLHI